MKYAREKYRPGLVAEMVPLWNAHFSEMRDKSEGILNPNLEFYEEMDRKQVLRIFTGRDEGVDLKAYQIFFIVPNPHILGTREAHQDILYLKPELRKGMTGYRFLKWCDRELLVEGIRTIHHRVSKYLDFGKLLERMGYELESKEYGKVVA